MTSHRENMYDPRFSSRKFKRFHRMTTSGYQTQVAFDMGEGSVLTDVGKRWRSNPYPPGKRHDAYEAGRAAGQQLLEDERQIKQWR